MNTWDFGPDPLDEGFASIRANGFRCFEALLGDSLTWDQARLYHQTGDIGLPAVLSGALFLSSGSTPQIPKENLLPVLSRFVPFMPA